MRVPSSRTFAAICSVETRTSATSSACWGRETTVMSAQLSQVANLYERRARTNAIPPSARTASAATPKRIGPGPEAGTGPGVDWAATTLGEADTVALGVSAAATVGVAVGLGDGVTGASVVAAAVGATVGAAVGATVGGAVRTGVGGAVGLGVGGAVGGAVAAACTITVPCMEAPWTAQS